MKHFKDFEGREVDSIGLFLRSIGTKLPLDVTFDEREAHWSKLHNARSDVRKAANKVLSKIKDTNDENESRRANEAHDFLMAAHDFLQDEMSLRDSFDTKEPLTLAQRGIPAASERGTLHMDENGNSEFVPEGRSRANAEYRDKKGNPVRVLRPNEAIAEGRSRNGVGEIFRAMALGADKAHLSDSERRALSEGTDSAGGYTVPTRLATYFIDKLRAQSVVFRAGALTVPMDSDNLAIARVTGDPTCAWTAENAEITASDPTFDAVTLAPKKLACLVKLSRELLEDSVNIADALEASITGQMSVEMDSKLLFGSGSSNQPTGLFNISGINSVSMGTNGAALTSYDPLLDMQYEIAVDNGSDPSAFIMHPRTRTAFAKLKDGDGNPVGIPADVASIPRLSTTSVPINQTQGSSSVASTVLGGDFSKMLVGVRRSLEIRLLNERYAEFDQVAFLATLRVDVAVTHPVHFCKLIGVIPAA